jgi:queuine tRNA-ribosyltransferase
MNSSAPRRQLEPIDKECDCYACRHYTRAYLAHLVRAEEMLAPRMFSLHNIRYLHRLVERAREAITTGTYQDWALGWAERYFKGNIPGWFADVFSRDA